MTRKVPAKVRVPLHQRPMAVATIEEGATVGAVVGVNLWDADGELVNLQALIAAELGAIESPAVSPSAWGVLLDIPPNVREVEALATNGYVVRTSDGSWVTRFVEGVAGETTSAAEDGETGNATIGLWDVITAAPLALYVTQLDTKGRVIARNLADAGDVPVDAFGWTVLTGPSAQDALDAADTALAAALPDAPSDGTTYGRLNGAWSAAQPLATILTGLAAMGAGTGMVEQTGAATFAKRALGVAAGTSILTRADGDGRYILTTEKGAALGVAPLDAGGKVDATYLPPIAITDTFVVASQAAMLALTAEVGDIAVRTDITKTFILSASPATVLANWVELLFPADAVSSVFGRTGTVVALAGDYSAYYDAIGSAAAAQAASQPLNANLTALSSLAANRFIARSSAGAAAAKVISDDALAFVAAADNAAMRTALGLGTIAVQAASAVAITGGTINGTSIGATTKSTGAFTSVVDDASGLGSTIAMRLTDMNIAFGGVPQLVSAASTAANLPLTGFNYSGISVPFSTTAGMQLVVSTTQKSRAWIRPGNASAWLDWIELGRRGGVFTSAANGALTPNIDQDDMTIRTALNGATTINNPAGTKVNGRVHTIRLRDDGTGRALTWGGQWRGSSTQALPATTTANKTVTLVFVANADETTMDLIGYFRQI